MDTNKPTLYRIEVGLKPEILDPAANELISQIQSLGLTEPDSVQCVRVFWVEGCFERDTVERVACELLSDPVTEQAAVDAPVYPEVAGGLRTVEIIKKPGVMDPVIAHLKKSLADRGIDVTFASTGRKYLFFGALSDDELRTAARRILANDCIEEIHIDQPAPIHPVGGDGVFELRVMPLRGKDDDYLETLSREGCLSLTLAEMKQIQGHYESLGREPSDVELETIAQTWSEHCRHKTLRGIVEFTGPDGETKRYENLLKETIVRATEELNHPDCLSVFKDNAGVVRFNDEWALTFKAETHNHPSAIEPYGGAGTGIGGVIRDTLGTGLGAKPIANTDVFCFGMPDAPMEDLPEGTLHPKRVMNGVVSGVRDYGNRMGIPTLNGAVHFDPRYVGNPLVYCGSIGLIPVDKVDKESRPGDLIVALGGRTGRDGIHGATFSSIELSSDSEMVSSGAVQIGNAIEEKKVQDVLLQARDAGLFSCLTDCGAGGFSSAVGEMGEDIGAEVDLDAAPLKYDGLSYTEIWISEAQERMVLAVPPENLEAIEKLCEAEGVESTVLGKFTNDHVLTLRYKGVTVAEISMEFLHGGLPEVIREACWSGPVEATEGSGSAEYADGQADQDAMGVLKSILSHPTVASKESIIRQYDHEVQGATVIKPLVGVRHEGPGDAAVITPILGQTKGAAISNGLCPQFTDLDPREMARLAVDEAMRNSVAVGGDPRQTFILDNFSWGNTSKPEQLGTITLACEGATDAALAFGTPFISGKDSLNNEYSVRGEAIAIPGTLLISALSMVPDVRKCVTMDLKQAGNKVFLVGETADELGGSHYNLLTGRSVGDGQVPRVNLERAMKIFDALHKAISDGIVESCHDLSEGGLAVAAAEMAIAGGLGLSLGLGATPVALGCSPSIESLLFSESPTRFLVEVAEENYPAFQDILEGLPCAGVGHVMPETTVTFYPPEGQGDGAPMTVQVQELKEAWQRF